MNKREIAGYTRIQKRTAVKLYNAGEAIYLLPVNMRPGDPWIQPFKIKRGDHCIDDTASAFNHRISAYSYYNCQTKELGYYPAYYIRPGEGA